MDHLEEAQKTMIDSVDTIPHEQRQELLHSAIAHALIALVETLQESNKLRQQNIDDLVHERLENYIRSQ